MQNTECSNKLSLAEYLKKVSPVIIFYACTACIHSPPSSVSVFLNDCSCWFHCLRFYCLKLEQMVICLLNTKLCHAGIIIAAELAPCKSGFILWNRLKDSEEIHCTAGCLWRAEWMTLHSWQKYSVGGQLASFPTGEDLPQVSASSEAMQSCSTERGAEQGCMLENCPWGTG